MAIADLTAQRLRELIHYDPASGAFTWNTSRRKCARGGCAGGADQRGYIRIRLDYQHHYAHRLAWLYMTGRWPAQQVDHRNLNKSDNRWDNLREATQKQNCENFTINKRTTSGVLGVTWFPRTNTWRARICHNRIETTLGYFKTIEEARACRVAAEQRLFTHSQACAPRPACLDHDGPHESGVAAPSP